MLALAEQDSLQDFAFHPARMGEAADLVASVTRAAYPTLAVPHHARWRHFAAGGVDRWGALAREVADAQERARIGTDLCVVSVLLDAGAGASWGFVEGGARLTRSEGLAVASLHAFRAGLFSSDPRRPWQADAAGLRRLDAARLGEAFQVGTGNPLVGLEGRVALMHGLADAVEARPDLFGTDPPRIGNLFDWLRRGAAAGALSAEAILHAVLEGLAPAWPARCAVDGVSLGDVWPHPALGGLVPFHKLSQWLAYSLIEVLEDAGLAVTGIDRLTGLPEYRNGGLFLDTGVLSLRDPALAAVVLPVGHSVVVGWRALTVALLDRIADCVRARLGVSAAAMPLSRVLEGGTWAAGREIARRLRPGGEPPLKVESDGTVF
ncbi:MAG: DUF1688 family protein [Acetobacteraceae bacterium]|nr:DUF1688 family protein [Acetobacteraceae bacterium]